MIKRKRFEGKKTTIVDQSINTNQFTYFYIEDFRV